ncbi:hypothetical protein AB205_0181000, partial [Aquarana catesbeiana]
MCNTQEPCPIDGTWTNWEEWSECKRLSADLVKCKQRVALQHRKRQCVGARFEGKWCEGEARESRSCYNVDGCFCKLTDFIFFGPTGCMFCILLC